MEPILKWAGGKRQLIPKLKQVIGNIDLGNNTYYEPFFGGGALFFNLECKNAVISDINEEIMNVYIQARDNLNELIIELEKHRAMHSEEYFYQIRSLDRTENFNSLSKVVLAARTIYLNKTCFNGLYRVNLKGQFNTPSGKYKKTNIYNYDNLINVSKLLNSPKVSIQTGSFSDILINAKKGSIIYLDPPYDYENSGFVNYYKEGFSKNDLIKMKAVCDKLINRDCTVIISNNDTTFVRELFSEDSKYTIYEILPVYANRNINSNGLKRGKVKEVIIYGKKSKDISAG